MKLSKRLIALARSKRLEPVFLCAGLAVLMLMAVYLSGSAGRFAHMSPQLAAAWESQMTSYSGYPSPLGCREARNTSYGRDRAQWLPFCYGYGVDGPVTPHYIKGGVFSASAGGVAQSRLSKSFVSSQTESQYSYRGPLGGGQPANDEGCAYSYTQSYMPTSCTTYGSEGEAYTCNPSMGECTCPMEEGPDWSVKYRSSGSNGAGCYTESSVEKYQWNHDASVLVGSGVSVSQGTPVTLEWACQPYQDVTITSVCKDWNFGGSCADTAEFTYQVPYSSGATAGGSAQFSGSKGTTGSATVTPNTTTTYSLTCGAYPSTPPRYTAWGDHNADWAPVGPIENTQPPALSLTVNVTATQSNSCANGLTYATYGPSCTCPSGQTQSGATCVATQSPGSAPMPTITATPSAVTSGQGTTLNYSSSGSPTSCTLSGGQFGSGTSASNPGSSATQPLTANTTYTYSCTNASGTGSASVTVTVTAAPEGSLPGPTISATPNPVVSGQGTTLNSSASGAPTSCTISGGQYGSGVVAQNPDTRTTSALTANTAYTYTCTNAVGSASASVTVGTVAATCPNGLNPAQYPSCTCPAGQSQSGNTCVAPTPTLTIAGNGQANTVSVVQGQSVQIVATFAPGSGDTLTRTSINDSNNNALVGWTPPANKNYTFWSPGPGTYTFYPAVTTLSYPAWNNYGKSLTVVVTCPSGTTNQGGSCVATQPGACTGQNEVGVPPNCNCRSGYERVGGVCQPVEPPPAATCTGANETGTPPNCQCETGYHRQGGACVLNACSGVNEVNWPSCTCASGFIRDAGQCVRQPVLSIEVNGASQVRVRRGAQVTITWSATSVQAGSCSVAIAGGGTLSAGQASGTLTRQAAMQTTYRLSCRSDAGTVTSAEATVLLIPDFIET